MSSSFKDLLKDKSLFREEAYIAGRWTGSTKKIDVTNPANGQVIGTIPALGRAEAADAIKAAREDGARIAVITSQPTLSTPKLADVLTIIPAQTMANDQSAKVSVLPMGSMFEIAETILFELIILRLRDRLGETAETMRTRHTNLE